MSLLVFKMAAPCTKRARKANWTKMEISRLIEGVSSRQETLFAKFKTTECNKKKQCCWAEVQTSVCASDCAAARSVDEAPIILCKIRDCLSGTTNCSFIYQECTRDRETCCTYGCCMSSLHLNYRAGAIAIQVISVVLCSISGWAFLNEARKLHRAKATLRTLGNPQASSETFAPTVLGHGPSLTLHRGSDVLFSPLYLELSKSPSSEVSFATAPPPPSLVSEGHLSFASLPTHWSGPQKDALFPDYGSTDPPLLETRNVRGALTAPRRLSPTSVSWNRDWARDDRSMSSPPPGEGQPAGQRTVRDGKGVSPASLDVSASVGSSSVSPVLTPEPASPADFPLPSDEDSKSFSSSSTQQGALVTAILKSRGAKNNGK